MQTAAAFIHEPAPDHPGWHSWKLADPTRFNNAVMGTMLLRSEGERSARLRLPEVLPNHTNLHGNVHGGVIMSLIDVGLYATMHCVLGPDMVGSVTLDLHCQFIGAGAPAESLDCIGEVVKETGRLVFLRGTVEQEHGLVASFVGTMRKPSRK